MLVYAGKYTLISICRMLIEYSKALRNLKRKGLNMIKIMSLFFEAGLRMG